MRGSVALMPSALWKPVGVLIREGAEVARPASLAETSRPNHLGRYPLNYAGGGRLRLPRRRSGE